MDKKCPKCESSDIKMFEYMGTKIIKCQSCGFDEGKMLDEFPSEKSNQKAKGIYSPYKSGGHSRISR